MELGKQKFTDYQSLYTQKYFKALQFILIHEVEIRKKYEMSLHEKSKVEPLMKTEGKVKIEE